MNSRRAVLAALMGVSACGGHFDAAPSVLLFGGEGASPGDVAALGKLLRRERLRFEVIHSTELDAMTQDQLSLYTLLIMPGGNFETIGRNLRRTTSIRIRESVASGMNYLGICAGAFFAGASPYNGLNLTGGVHFPFYALEHQGIRKAAVPIATPDGQQVEHYWEDGPSLTGWGEAIARYPNGEPAAVQSHFGEGWVVLTGFHPEADASWRAGMPFSSTVNDANAYAATLVHAAHDGAALPQY